MNPTNSSGDEILRTERLVVCKLTDQDAAFILELLNEPAFLRFIGDRGVRNIENAHAYLENGPFNSYKVNGFGLWRVDLIQGREPVGMCGLLKRDGLQDIDIGYAYLARHWSKGYASEAAQAVRDYAFEVLGVNRLVAITDPLNVGSMHVLEKIGMKFDHKLRLSPNSEEVNLFVIGEKS